MTYYLLEATLNGCIRDFFFFFFTIKVGLLPSNKKLLFASLKAL